MFRDRPAISQPVKKSLLDSVCCNHTSLKVSAPKKEYLFSSPCCIGHLLRPSPHSTAFWQHFITLSISLTPLSLSPPLRSQSRSLLRYPLCVLPLLCFSSLADFDPPSFSQKPIFGLSVPQSTLIALSAALTLVPILPRTSVLCSNPLQSRSLCPRAFFRVSHCFGPLSWCHDAFKVALSTLLVLFRTSHPSHFLRRLPESIAETQPSHLVLSSLQLCFCLVPVPPTMSLLVSDPFLI